MAVAFTHLSWWFLSGKRQKPNISCGSSLNSSSDAGLLELDALRFHFNDRRSMASSSRRVKRKWQIRDERRKIDREYDVIAPLDGGCISGSESDDSDWSIGWLEHHDPGFQSGDDSEDGFAVLVPCYGRGCRDQETNLKAKLLKTFGNIPDVYAGEALLKRNSSTKTEGREMACGYLKESKIHVEQWLLSLQRT